MHRMLPRAPGTGWSSSLRCRQTCFGTTQAASRGGLPRERPAEDGRHRLGSRARTCFIKDRGRGGFEDFYLVIVPPQQGASASRARSCFTKDREYGSFEDIYLVIVPPQQGAQLF
mmetsp:Transcript_122148/g.340485  ORF Transcript_122148/g.340485 Transcript_122148/m.340485 type:complete len:115 (-) Transcript_122148:422-766(-)